MNREINETFHVRVNEGPEQQISTRTTTYIHAAMVAYAELDVPGEQRDKTHIEIWIPDLLPNYGPYHYLVGENEFGHIVVASAIEKP